jgi:hypothetical protein
LPGAKASYAHTANIAASSTQIPTMTAAATRLTRFPVAEIASDQARSAATDGEWP